MKSKVGLITAANGPMGQLYAKKMLEQGWKLAALEANPAGLDALPNSSTLLCMNVDTTDEKAVTPSARKTLTELDPIRRVVNAAGIMRLSRILDQEIGLTEIKYGNLVNLAHVNLQDMLERQRDELISFASLAGHLSVFYVGAYIKVLYQKNKGEDVNFTRVCPPPVQTPPLNQTRKTVYSKILGILQTLSPEAVITKIDRACKNSKFRIFPGPATKSSWLFRRFFPGLTYLFIRAYKGL